MTAQVFYILMLASLKNHDCPAFRFNIIANYIYNTLLRPLLIKSKILLNNYRLRILILKWERAYHDVKILIS